MAVLSRRIRTTLSLFSSIYVIGLVLSSKTIRGTVKHLLSPSTHPFRLLTLLTALILNAKSLPLVWHIRIFWPMLYQLYLQPQPLPQDALFRPIITKGCRTSVAETDYNLHKSNSTYFADFDVGRAAIICALLRKGIRGAAQAAREDSSSNALPGTRSKVGEIVQAETTLSTPHADDADPPPATQRPTQTGRERFLIALGGVSCSFKRELAPSEEFDIWTRVLSWDRKWIYLVSHMIKAGTVQPDGYELQPWKSQEPSWIGMLFGARRKGGSAASAKVSALRQVEKEGDESWRKAIFATSISKYVVKRGRMTVPPELVWMRSDRLPPKPDEGSEKIDHAGDPYAWNWANVEKERQRGWELAQHFAGLEAAADEFPLSWPRGDGHQLAVLGEFVDVANF